MIGGVSGALLPALGAVIAHAGGRGVGDFTRTRRERLAIKS